MSYELTKKIWDETDFEQMGWHDCKIYKFRLTEDLEFDIDYILQWNAPDIEGLPFTFWISPATLIFKKPQNLTFELDSDFQELIEIEDIDKINANNKTIWTINTQQGYFEFESDGYEQYIRQEPFFEFGQTISWLDRYGTSLEKITNQDNPNRNREENRQKRQKELEDYERVKQRTILKKQQEEIYTKKINNEIDTKSYLVRKKEIKELIEFHDYWLKGSRFENW